MSERKKWYCYGKGNWGRKIVFVFGVDAIRDGSSTKPDIEPVKEISPGFSW